MSKLSVKLQLLHKKVTFLRKEKMHIILKKKIPEYNYILPHPHR